MNKKELQKKLDAAYAALDRRDAFIEGGEQGKTGMTVYLESGEIIHLPTAASSDMRTGFLHLYRHTGRLIQGFDVELVTRVVNHW